jgi:acyl CoA:acetate/3-ketoacid CoA transferase beta subunit
MADYRITIFMDDEKLKKVEGAGLADKIVTLDGKKAVQVEMTAKDQKKLVKGFPALTFDADNACTLPAEAEGILLGIVSEMKTLDVMKFAIMKLYNPLAGKAPRSAQR